MKRSLLLMCAFVLLTTAAFAQASGSLTVTVRSAPDSATVAGPIAGAKVIVVHWSNDGMHPTTMVQDRIATTNQMGTCTIELPPGTYDVFIAASELGPAAFRREVRPGATTSLSASLKPAPSHLSPVK